MHTSSNTAQVITELSLLLYGIPIAGLVTSILCWRTSLHESDPNRQQYQRLGFIAAAFGFFVPLLVLALSYLPQRMQTLSLVGWFPLIALAGVLASLTGTVLLILNSRGYRRILGPALCLIATTYCTFTIFAFLAGGAGL